ncbi:UNVERIFIED_CONTAM: hypothetical protein Slati_3714200 [Sesamum latifolium]|uniref:Uncharacterized protein n=1 Tax=Sesamum latifolium TaxID=2727402 RepID=A0AAW2U1Z6_9LAMI
MPIRNRINLFHVEHYRRDIIVPIVLFLDIVCHRCQYDAADLPVVLLPPFERHTFFRCRALRQGYKKRLIQNVSLVLEI